MLSEVELEVLNTFVVPLVAATIVIGSVRRKLAWYAGAAALLFVADILVAGVFMTLRTMGKDASHEIQVMRFVLVVLDGFVIQAAINTGARCQACNARIHPKATRCPKCLKYFA